MSTVRYQTLGPLLSGAGSRAFLALRVPEGALLESIPVVLIWLPEETAQEPETLAEVERETRRAAQLDHPHIVRVLDFIDHDKGKARVVEYADGESLRRVLEASRVLPASLAALVTADAAMGAHYAHLAGNDDGTPLVHGDLRPETLLVSFGGQTKVSGYGALALAPKRPGDRRIRGRRLHCAPEQVVGGRSAVNVQTDVYLLGLVLYECLLGEIPFADEEDFDQAVLTKPTPELPADVCPPPLAEVIHRAMAKKAGDRYPSAIALREAIEAAVGSLPSYQAMADFLKGLFPPDDPARAARQQMLEEGLASLATEVGPKASALAGASATAERDPAGARPTKTTRPPSLWGFSAAALALMAGGWAIWTLLREPAPVRSAVPPIAIAARDDAGPQAASEPPGAGAAASSEPPDSGAAPEATAAAPAAAPPAPEPSDRPSSASAPAEASLSLSIEPPVEVAIDGRPVGRSPLTVSVAPGRHLLHLTDRGHGINTTRTVVLAIGAQSERIYLSRGYVNIAAPEGAEIFIDGKSYGKAPRQEIGVYEGNHKVVVNVAGAHWRQSFEARPNQRVNFTVNFQ